jgi:septum formation protein
MTAISTKENFSSTFWIGKEPLVLASNSAIRSHILTSVNIPHTIQKADVDERKIEEQTQTLKVEDVAIELAVAKAQNVSLALAKAQDVSVKNRGLIILGADQMLECEGMRYHKPQTIADGRKQLGSLRGRVHTLYSAYALVRDGEVLHASISRAHMTMRPFSDSFLDSYIEAVGENVMKSVGCYQVEGLGQHLFANMEGEYTAILGLPILSLLQTLRDLGFVKD